MRLESLAEIFLPQNLHSGKKKNNKILGIGEVASIRFMKGEKSAEQGRVV